MTDYVLITGATSGFGKACSHKFAENGYNLIITGRREDKLIQLEQELTTKFNVKVEISCFDVRNEEKVIEKVQAISENSKKEIRILINNAGLAVGRGPLDEGLSDDWNRMIDTNIKGLLYVTKAILPFLKSNGRGHIFNLGSIAGKEVYPGGNVYCASKHAVDALSKAMRIDLLPHGIKVTNIAPGAAETEFSLVRFKGDDEMAKSVYTGFQPLVAEDIADVIYFAATRPAHVTINDLVITPTAQATGSIIHRDLNS